MVRNVTTLPRVLAPADVDGLLGVMRTERDRAMTSNRTGAARSPLDRLLRRTTTGTRNPLR